MDITYPNRRWGHTGRSERSSLGDSGKAGALPEVVALSSSGLLPMVPASPSCRTTRRRGYKHKEFKEQSTPRGWHHGVAAAVEDMHALTGSGLLSVSRLPVQKSTAAAAAKEHLVNAVYTHMPCLVQHSFRKRILKASYTPRRGSVSSM
jgi:hypothetical protein